MAVLGEAKEWAMNNLIDEDTIAIYLVGSWARGEDDPRDIDVIVIKQAQLAAMYNTSYKQPDFSLDVWVYDKDSLEEDLFTPVTCLADIINASLELLFIPDAVVWYEKEEYLNSLQSRTSNWKWDPSYVKFFEFPDKQPSMPWLKLAYDESIHILQAAKTRLSEGKPITHRRKDYPELLEDGNSAKAGELMELVDNAYNSLGIETHWPEYDDARKALTNGRNKIAFAMLKDVLRFIVRYELPSAPEELLDPTLWTSIEVFHLSDPTKKAVEFAFS